MKNVEFLGIELQFYCNVDYTQYDLGSVRLECDGRSFIVDVVNSEITHPVNCTVWNSKVEIDKETFPETECKYDLEMVDLFDSRLKATIYIGQEYDIEPDSMALFVRIGGENGTTKAIELTNECD